MGKSVSKIRLDYQKMMKQAEELDSIAKYLKKESKDELEAANSTLASGWKSDGSLEYGKKMARCMEQVQQQIKAVEKSAETLRQIAKAMYQAEMTALDIAEKRTYNG